MIIAIDITNSAPEDHFAIDYFTRLAKQHPQNSFIFIGGKEGEHQKPALENVQTVLAQRPASILLLSYWYNYKVTALLRKYKADIFIAAKGICSLRSAVPQCLLIQDISFIQSPATTQKKYKAFYKKNLPGFLNKAKMIVTLSAFSKQTIVEKYKIGEQKINIIHPGIDEKFTAIDEDAKETLKEKYAGGKEYFLYKGGTTSNYNLLNLLKAFSFFKKRQKSNMQLLIIATGNDNSQFLKDLSTYKLRDEVKFLTNLFTQEMVNITAAAYAFVYPVLFENFPTRPLEAMRLDIPVICSNEDISMEICGDAALYADPDNFNDIAANMMLIFKDEEKRNELIRAGRIQAQQFDWNKATDQLWDIITTMQQ